MSYEGTPTSVRSLEQRIRNLEGDEGLTQRRRVSMALVVVGQMLPAGAIKGVVRWHFDMEGTRFTRDLDAARIASLAVFRSEFIDASGEAWRVAAHEWFERRLDDPDFGIFVFDDLRLDDLYAHHCVQ